MRIAPALLGRGGLTTGVVLIAAGYAGTLWCYWAMGDRWRMGIDRKQKGPLVTRGPYRVVRHPIYLFQIVMLVGVVILLPVWLAMAVLSLHWVCVVIKALDEETHLLEAYGAVYRNYAAQTGMLLPRLPKRVPKMKNRPD
jgi:protein-S-isoprenylcysteine O-methyltransferase Ste14